MSLSMYQASTPVFIRVLNNLSAILDKALAHAEAKKIDLAIFINARLTPGMYPLSKSGANCHGSGERLRGAPGRHRSAALR